MHLTQKASPLPATGGAPGMADQRQSAVGGVNINQTNTFPCTTEEDPDRLTGQGPLLVFCDVKAAENFPSGCRWSSRE